MSVLLTQQWQTRGEGLTDITSLRSILSFRELSWQCLIPSLLLPAKAHLQVDRCMHICLSLHCVAVSVGVWVFWVFWVSIKQVSRCLGV